MENGAWGSPKFYDTVLEVRSFLHRSDPLANLNHATKPNLHYIPNTNGVPKIQGVQPPYANGPDTIVDQRTD